MKVTIKKIAFKQDDDFSKQKSIKTKAFWYIDELFSCVGCMGVYTALFCYLVLYNTLSYEIICYSLSGAMISLSLNKLISK
jgi:hypothetical protein